MHALTMQKTFRSIYILRGTSYISKSKVICILSNLFYFIFLQFSDIIFLFYDITFSNIHGRIQKFSAQLSAFCGGYNTMKLFLLKLASIWIEHFINYASLHYTYQNFQLLTQCLENTHSKCIP